MEEKYGKLSQKQEIMLEQKRAQIKEDFVTVLNKKLKALHYKNPSLWLIRNKRYGEDIKWLNKNFDDMAKVVRGDMKSLDKKGFKKESGDKKSIINKNKFNKIIP